MSKATEANVVTMKCRECEGDGKVLRMIEGMIGLDWCPVCDGHGVTVYVSGEHDTP